MVSVRRKAQTQSEAYWRRDFKVRPEDIEAVYDLILEEGQPRTLGELAREVMARHCRREAQAREPGEAVPYRPKEHYSVGQQLYFPHLGYLVGQVVGVRPGQNPRYGEFSVISVAIEGQEGVREFAAGFAPPHILNDYEEATGPEDGQLSVDELYERYGDAVRQALRQALEQNSEFVSRDEQWFLRGLLPEVHVGYLNLAEAIIDVAGRPLSAEEILQQLDLAPEARPQARVFALNLALEGDERFDNVGTVEQPRWFLYNLEPPAVVSRPEVLYVQSAARGGEWLHRESLDIAREIGDELDELPGEEVPVLSAETGRASVVVSFPHRQAGTFPLTREVLALFPTGEYTRIPIHIVDSGTDARWMGWVLPDERYGWGLAEWYKRAEIPAGATIDLLMTREPYTIAVQCDVRPRRSEWVRVPHIENARLTFEIRKRAYTCRYDRNLLLGEPLEPERLEEVRRQYRREYQSLFQVILRIFPELAKLGSQGLVHAKALYAAVNVVWRSGAVPIFAELARHACFDPVGDGNWAFDDSLTNVVYTTPEEMETRPHSRRVDVIRDRVLCYGSRP